MVLDYCASWFHRNYTYLNFKSCLSATFSNIDSIFSDSMLNRMLDLALMAGQSQILKLRYRETV